MRHVNAQVDHHLSLRYTLTNPSESTFQVCSSICSFVPPSIHPNFWRKRGPCSQNSNGAGRQPHTELSCTEVSDIKKEQTEGTLILPERVGGESITQMEWEGNLEGSIYLQLSIKTRHFVGRGKKGTGRKGIPGKGNYMNKGMAIWKDMTSSPFGMGQNSIHPQTAIGRNASNNIF